MDIIEVIFMIIAIFTAFQIVRESSFINTIILLCMLSVILMTLYVWLKAPDVAITEAAIGAAVSTIILIRAYRLIQDEAVQDKMSHFIPFLCITISTYLAYFVIKEFPALGGHDIPAMRGAAKYYIENAEKEIGVKSIAAAILASYRGFDTFGETSVIFTAGVAVLAIMNKKKHGNNHEA